MNRPDPLARARALFEAQAEALEPTTAARLRAARRTALAEAGPRAGAAAPTQRWGWPAAGGLLTAALALLLVAPPLRLPPPEEAAGPAPAVPVATDPAALAEAVAPELDEDASFLLWLGEAPLPPAKPPAPIDLGALP
jgi:hypothetical protein